MRAKPSAALITRPTTTVIDQVASDRTDLPGMVEGLEYGGDEVADREEGRDLATAELDLSCNQRPDTKSSAKNTVLVIGAAAEGLGMNAVIVIPSAEKMS